MSATPIQVDAPAPATAPNPPARAHPSRWRDLLTLARPRQWPKNLLVVPLPLLDPTNWRWPALVGLAGAVVAFTLASALVYVGNDIVDRHRDAVHPVKRHRPVAAGRIPVPLAAGFGAGIAAALAGTLASGPPALAGIVAVYLLLNVAYSLRLKHVPLLDLFVVALGFQLRAVAGYVAASATVSRWMLVCVLALCLMMIVGKRRRELDLPDRSHRPALVGYSPVLLEHLLVLSAVLAVVAFLLAVQTEVGAGAHSGLAVLVSVPPALLGLFRYLQAVLVDLDGADPVRVLVRDRVITVTLLVWAVVLGGVLLAARLDGTAG